MATKKNKGTVGVIGLGIMGGAFARNLVAAGWRVVGYDISAASARSWRKGPASRSPASASDVAARPPIIITSLPKPRGADATAKRNRRREAAARASSPKCSTFTIEDKEKAEQRARARPATPCSTARSAAPARRPRTGDLVIYASGDTQGDRQAQAGVRRLSRKAYDVGAFGNGSRMKYVANLLVAINNVACAEAMVLGMKAGPRSAASIFEMI